MEECLLKEVGFRTSRASGPGGQHVNKTESRVELLWDPETSGCIDDQQKAVIQRRLASRLNEKGILILACEKFRSQHRNKAEVTERFLTLVQSSLAPQAKRIPTKPTRSSKEKRIQAKKTRGEIKQLRKNPPRNETDS